MPRLDFFPLLSSDDGVPTETSTTQHEIEHELSAILQNARSRGSLPTLNKHAHVQYLGKNLYQLPSPFVSLDASRPWMLYWILHSFDLLGIAIDQQTKDRAIATVLSFQHPTGGFAGGPGQIPHLLPTYAAVCSLAILNGGWEEINREALLAFFLRMKRPDGSFTVCDGGEVDVRGVYCLLATATLLNLLSLELVEGTADFIASCQTYEGGFAASSSSISSTFVSPFAQASSLPSLHSNPSLSATPLGEAHGGYTSCAVLSNHLLQPLDAPRVRSIDSRALLRWTVQMQASAPDGGGFKGRTNKLVDGCYGWWVGGSMAVVEELVKGDRPANASATMSTSPIEEAMLFSRVALQEYVLLLAQHPAGGLRDKPYKNADFYHTANNLSGLSAAQHKLLLDRVKMAELRADWHANPSAKGTSDDELHKAVFVHALSWQEDDAAFFALGEHDASDHQYPPTPGRGDYAPLLWAGEAGGGAGEGVMASSRWVRRRSESLDSMHKDTKNLSKTPGPIKMHMYG